MKKCKHCKEEINKDAKRCPKCSGDLRSWIVRHPILTVLFSIIGLVIFTSTNKGGNVSKVDSTKQASEMMFKVGDVVKTDDLEITITSVKERTSVGSGYFVKKPSEGGVYLTVQWSYKNISSQPIGSFDTPMIKLVDSNNTVYDSDIGTSGNFATELNLDRKIFSDLNPGILVKDATVFEVSKDLFNKDTWKIILKVDGKDIKVNL